MPIDVHGRNHYTDPVCGEEFNKELEANSTKPNNYISETEDFMY